MYKFFKCYNYKCRELFYNFMHLLTELVPSTLISSVTLLLLNKLKNIYSIRLSIFFFTFFCSCV